MAAFEYCHVKTDLDRIANGSHFCSQRSHLVEPNLFDCCESSPEIYSCQECKFKTDFLLVSRLHTRQFHQHDKNLQFPHYDFTKRTCRTCEFDTYSWFHWQKHLLKKCDDSKPKLLKSVQRYSELKTVCSYCGQEVRKYLFSQHVATKHVSPQDVRWHKCDICGFQTKTELLLKAHVKRKHTTPEVLPETTYFFCDFCTYRTHAKKYLKIHVQRMHERKNEFKCEHCDYVTTTSSNLFQHKKTHIASKDFACDKCDYKTTTNRYLQLHLERKHLIGAKNRYECDECGYHHWYKEYVRQHKARIHGSKLISNVKKDEK